MPSDLYHFICLILDFCHANYMQYNNLYYIIVMYFRLQTSKSANHGQLVRQQATDYAVHVMRAASQPDSRCHWLLLLVQQLLTH